MQSELSPAVAPPGTTLDTAVAAPVETPTLIAVHADDPAAVATTPQEAVEFNRDKDSGYSLRRMIFVFGTVGFLLVSNTAFVAFSYTGELVTKYVEASFSMMGAIVLYYLGAGVLDRSNMLRRIGEGFGRRRDGDGDGDGRDRGDVPR